MSLGVAEKPGKSTAIFRFSKQLSEPARRPSMLTIFSRNIQTQKPSQHLINPKKDKTHQNPIKHHDLI